MASWCDCAQKMVEPSMCNGCAAASDLEAEHEADRLLAIIERIGELAESAEGPWAAAVLVRVREALGSREYPAIARPEAG